jgi:hypothetical protein
VTRILIHVEGQTEEEFVNSVLAPHLYNRGFTSISARLVGKSRLRKKRGGTCSWDDVRTEIYRHLSRDPAAYATTIVDFYALPASGSKEWPGRGSCEGMSVRDKAFHIQSALAFDLERHHGAEISSRFIPFVAMYEFEGLLFSDPSLMAQGMGRIDLAPQFLEIRNRFETPEHINDSPHTAPSKRIQAIIPRYDKVLFGNVAAMEVTLARMRQECPVFANWLSSLEALS